MLTRSHSEIEQDPRDLAALVRGQPLGLEGRSLREPVLAAVSRLREAVNGVSRAAKGLPRRRSTKAKYTQEPPLRVPKNRGMEFGGVLVKITVKTIGITLEKSIRNLSVSGIRGSYALEKCLKLLR